MREKVNGFVGVMAVAILCMVSGLCMVWGIAPVVLAVYVAACAVCGRYMITCIGCAAGVAAGAAGVTTVGAGVGVGAGVTGAGVGVTGVTVAGTTGAAVMVNVAGT